MRLFIFLVLTAQISWGQADKKVGGPCDRCELMFEGMPPNLNWETTLVTVSEPGQPLLMSGTIFRSDGKTPAPDVILYVYQTDNTGEYSPEPNQVHGKVHGHIRGWMKTDAKGRYQFKTIRPGHYPSRQAPEHIHPIIKEEGKTLYWIDEYLFDDDPLLTREERSRQEKRGGDGIIKLTKNSKGTWEGKRDIILGMNIPSY
jgi:protocatechuate 3,4-dioxygenase beta subunit